MASPLCQMGSSSGQTFGPTRSGALKIAAGYALIGVLWIFGSGWLLNRLIEDNGTKILIEHAKGWLYVVVTAGLLWLALDKYFEVIRRSAQMLQQSEERCRFALDASGDGIWDWDFQTNQVSFSSQWKRGLGFEEPEIGTSFSEWESRIHPDDLGHVRLEIQRHFEGQAPSYSIEHRIRTKVGTYRWVLNRGKVISRTPDGKPLRVLSTQSDITEKHCEKLVMEARLRLLEFSPRHSLEQLLTSMLDEARDLTGSKVGLCLFLEPLEKTLRIKSFSSDETQASVDQWLGQSLPVGGDGIWCKCLARKLPVISDQPMIGDNLQSSLNLKRQLAVPVMREHRIVAIVCVANKPLRYDDSDIQAVSHLADLAWDIADRKRAEEASATQLEELRRWHALMLGREERVQELKREVNELCALQGRPTRYPSQLAEDCRLVT